MCRPTVSTPTTGKSTHPLDPTTHTHKTKTQRPRLQQELEAATEDVGRRDVEYAKCDAHHCNLVQCNDTVLAAGGNLSEVPTRLVQVQGEREELVQRVTVLTEAEEE